MNKINAVRQKTTIRYKYRDHLNSQDTTLFIQLVFEEFGHKTICQVSIQTRIEAKITNRVPTTSPTVPKWGDGIAGVDALDFR